MRGVVAWAILWLLACSAGQDQPAGSPDVIIDTAGAGAPITTGGGGQPGAAAGSPGPQGGSPSAGSPSAGSQADMPAAGAASVPAPSDAGGVAAAPDAGAADPLGEPALSHTFETLSVQSFEEQQGLCQSWTLGNTESIWVHVVRAHNDGAVHHSNWIWVTDDLYPGDDGTWPCAERGFDQIIAGAFGGVFFAQSTQSRVDEQRFPDGVAFELPPHARIIGDIHLLNTNDQPIETAIGFDVYSLPAEEVQVALQPMAFTNLALDIAPAGKTLARMQCALPQPDLNVYYILPHFHELGLSMTIDVAGGPLDGMELWHSQASYGEPLGETFDTPLPITGAAGLGITCEFQNPRDQSVVYGFGDQEMCVVLIYSDGAKAGGAALTNLTVDDSSGDHQTDALCVAVGT